MKVNIGKNTLGDSNKMSLNLREYGRSTHDLSFAWRSTMGVGALTPFMKILALPGDTFEIDLQNKILTAPTIGPLFGSFKFQTDIFTCPIRLYNAMLHNNALNIGLDMKKVKLPKILMENQSTKGYFGETSTSSLKNLLEYRDTGLLNAVPVLAYYDIFKNYYANKQEKKFPMYAGVRPGGSVTITSSGVGKVDELIEYHAYAITEENEKDIFDNATFIVTSKSGKTYEIKGKELLGGFFNKRWVSSSYTSETTNFKVNNLGRALSHVDDNEIIGENWLQLKNTAESIRKIELFNLEEIDNLREYILSKGKQEVVFDDTYKTNDFLTAARKKETTKEDLGGLCLKTYQSDIFNNWINSEWIEGENGISKITAIDTSSGSFTIDTINLAKKVYEMLNRIAISGGTYKDWIETVYTTDYYFRAETPVYEGGMSSEIEFEEIVSQSASNTDGYEPLGTLAGRGINTARKGGNIVIKVNEPCYIMGIASITPRVDYSQGSPFDLSLNTLDDIHKPQLDGIGYQDLIATKLDWRVSRTIAIGKQPAWLDYTTNYNKTFGKFAAGESQEYMVLNRVYDNEYDTKKPNASTYIDPSLYNKIFATTGNQEQNFWVQIGCGIKARRVMSARQIPNF